MEAERRCRVFNNIPRNGGWGRLCCSLCPQLKVLALEEFSGEKAFTYFTIVSWLLGLQQKTEREWMFGLLRQGMRDKYCYELCARRGVLHVILSFFSSPLCDDVAQVGGPRSWGAEAWALAWGSICQPSPRGVSPSLASRFYVSLRCPGLGAGPVEREGGDEYPGGSGTAESSRNSSPHK